MNKRTPSPGRRTSGLLLIALALGGTAERSRADGEAGPIRRPVTVVPDDERPVGTSVVDGDASMRIVRTRVADDFPLPGLLDAPWRLDIEWTLGRDGTDRILVDGAGAATRFTPHRRLGDGTWRWTAPDGALLDGGRGVYRLREANGRTIEFDGAHPVEARSADGTVERWSHEGGRPTLHVSASGQHRWLRYDRGGLVSVHTDAGTTVRYRVAERVGASSDTAGPGSRTHRSARCPADERCDSDASPVPAAFARGPTIPGASTLDVRPSHCGSHFAEPGAVIRGDAIERGLEGVGPHARQSPTSRSFPVVDFVGPDELVVVRSRDLASPSYADAGRDALHERLMRDGREVEALLIAPLASDGAVAVTAERGDTGVARVQALPGRTVVLELVVRHGIASPAQILQIERARIELARRHRITLRVVEIP